MLIKENEIAWSPSPVESTAFSFAIPLPKTFDMTLTLSSYLKQNRALLKRLIEEADPADIDEANWIINDTPYLRRVLPKSFTITDPGMDRLLIGEIDIPYTGLWQWKSCASELLNKPQRHQDSDLAREVLDDMDLLAFLNRIL